MNLVQSALRRPFTLIVLVTAVVLAAVLALSRMPRDIFPTLGIPTIYVAQPYGGMDPAQMEGFLTYYYEYHFLYITGIEHVESKSIQGAAIMKLQFYPNTDMSQAMAETVQYVNRARAFMPPGTVPPFVMRFDAGSVPVGTLVFSSETRSVAEMQDAALNLVRPLFATLPGVSAPPPFGGAARSIVVNLDPERLRAYNMSPDEVVAAISRANLISPSGNMAIAGKYPMVPLNSVVKNIKDLETVPIRTGVYPTVFLRDVGKVVDGSDIVVFAHTHRPSEVTDKHGRMFINPGETGGWFFRQPNVTLLETETRDICRVNLDPGMAAPGPQGPEAMRKHTQAEADANVSSHS